MPWPVDVLNIDRAVLILDRPRNASTPIGRRSVIASMVCESIRLARSIDTAEAELVTVESTDAFSLS